MTRQELLDENADYLQQISEHDALRQLPDETECMLRNIARIKAVAVACGAVDAYALADQIERQIEELQGWCG